MILYLGNKMSSHGLTPTAMEDLVPRLSKIFNIKDTSSKKNIFVRFFHMNYIYFCNIHKLSLIIIDVFSSRAFYFALFFGILSKIFSIPYITVVRGGDMKKRMKISPGLTSYLFNNSAINVVPSHYFLEILIDRGFNVTCIPNFIDIPKYTLKFRKSIRPKLLWVRSFHEIYNPTMAIKVLDILSKEYDDAILTMVGPDKDGSKDKCIKLANKLGVKNNLKIMGRLQKEEWGILSKDSDIFINTTHIDNTPISVIEAMALGLPIVSTNVGGIPYLLKNKKNALLVNDNDSIDMVNKIKFLINNESQSKKLSQNGRLVAKNFSWEQTGPKWIKIIKIFAKKNANMLFRNKTSFI